MLVDAAEYTIVPLNAVLAFGLAWPLASHLADALGGAGTRRRTYLPLIVVYVIESFAFNARSILSAGDGSRFGVPDFLPWPLNTILGFCVSVVLVAVIGKVVITTGIVQWMTEVRRSVRKEEPR